MVLNGNSALLCQMLSYKQDQQLELLNMKIYLVVKTPAVAPLNHRGSVLGTIIDMLIGNAPKGRFCGDRGCLTVMDDIERSVLHIGGIDSVVGSSCFVLHQHKSVFRRYCFFPGGFGYLPGRRLGGVSARIVCGRAGAEQKRQCQQNK